LQPKRRIIIEDFKSLVAIIDKFEVKMKAKMDAWLEAMKASLEKAKATQI
jgi:hypothetical protein